MTIDKRAKYMARHTVNKAIDYISRTDVKSVVLFTICFKHTYYLYQLVFSIYILFANLTLYKKIAYSLLIYGLVSVYIDILSNAINSIITCVLYSGFGMQAANTYLQLTNYSIIKLIQMELYRGTIVMYLYL
jgi:hypothetical protein